MNNAKWCWLALACLTAPAAHAASFSISPVSFDFGDVGVGSSGIMQRVTVTNTSTTSQTLTLAGGGGGLFGGSQNCQGSTLAPGASCFVDYDFRPTATGAAAASTSLSVNGQTATFNFTGNGITSFRVNARALDFGNVAVGATSPTQTVTVTNTSHGTQTLNLVGGGGGMFGGSQNCQGQSLAAGASCQVFYRLTPTAAGPTTGSTDLGINGQDVGLSFAGEGGGTSPFLVTGRAFDFGNVAVGDAAPLETVTVTNTSGTAQTLSLAGGGGGVFGGSQNCQGETLAPGASCQVFYIFQPTAAGAATGSTALAINGNPYDFTFAGNGIEPLLLGALSFDFGEVDIGQSSGLQQTNLYNVSDSARLLSLAGGGGGVFGGSQNCQGNTLAPSDFCSIFYRFTPTVAGLITGSTTLSFNGITRSISFRGIGINPNGGSTAVPEPATWAIMLLGFAAIGTVQRRRRLSAAA